MSEAATARVRAIARLRATWGVAPDRLVRSPGRVNLIGEHTDYNDGYVLPLAIEPALWLAVAAPSDTPPQRLELVSDDAPSTVSVDVDAPGERRDGWAAYGQGMVWALRGDGVPLRPLRGAVASDIPVGAGLSSSAALELAVARALVDGPWQPQAMARLAQRAENEWVGVRTGIMDQLSCASGREGHAMLIDCRSLEVTHVPLPTDVAVVIMDTATRRELVGSAYDERRKQCEAAAAELGAAALRDVDVAAVESLDDEILRRRARHVVTENARTIAAAQAMREGDSARLGALMDAGHTSLRDDFEVSSRELDLVVELAREQPGCLGARMTGAGFGGCAVAIVTHDRLPGLVDTVARSYHDETGLDAQLLVTLASNGTDVEPLDTSGS